MLNLKDKINKITQDIKFLMWGFYHPRKFYIDRSQGVDGFLGLFCQQDTSQKVYMSVTASGEYLIHDKTGKVLFLLSQSGTFNMLGSSFKLANYDDNTKYCTTRVASNGTTVFNINGSDCFSIDGNKNINSDGFIFLTSGIRIKSGTGTPSEEGLNGLNSGSVYLRKSNANPLWLNTPTGWINVDTEKIKVSS